MIENQAPTQATRQAAYDAWYIAEVDKGLADIAAGKVISDEDAKKEMAAHLAKLHKKHGHKAA